METEKQRFSSRLNEILDEAGFPPAQPGRQAAVAGLLDVEPDQVGLWLRGEAYPQTSKLVKLAQITQVRSNWLLCGSGEKYSNEIERQALQKRIMSEYRDSNSHEEIALVSSSLPQEALEIAHAYARIPEHQRLALRQLILAMAKHH